MKIKVGERCDSSISHRTPKNARNDQKLGERTTLDFPEGTNPANTLILDLQPPEL